ncbi:MAG: glycoside hydrolase family 57 protein [Burkholderiales bacterium]
MTAVNQLNVVFCWHMHQPDYRDHVSGEFALPWTYLHAIKDYTDMAWYLEQNQKARAVFNFVPILLDQLQDYSDQFATGTLRDPLLRLLAQPDLNNIGVADRALLLGSCFRANQATMIDPYPAYRQLQAWSEVIPTKGDGAGYLSGQYFADLLMWYHLTWFGETVRRDNPQIALWLAQAKGYTATDRGNLFHLIGKLLTDLMPRYRALLASGQIELSTTPHHHPITPLLLDFASAKESWPDVTLPLSAHYPGGAERARHHLRSAGESHRKRFGAMPHGIWPAEGGLSLATAKLFAEEGYAWTATGEAVLRNSLKATGQLPEERAGYLYRPYRVHSERNSITVFFRDDRLSDKIGFEYAKWLGKDAALDLVRELESIAESAPAGETPTVSIIMDGENAWEYYPYNGFYFLSELYSLLTHHTAISLTTFGVLLQQENFHARTTDLPAITAGSWVYGTFSTWIGSAPKNKAWDLLCAAKRSYDDQVNMLSESARKTAEQQLASCEASDWFWWPGDYNPSASVQSFDVLFRQNLANLYRLLELPIPNALNHPLSAGTEHGELSGAMRRVS